MTEYTRIINFRCYDLGTEDTTLVLTFNSEKIPNIFKNVFPIAYLVVELPKAGGFMLKATFRSQLGVTRAQVEDGIVQPADTYIPINVGQKTTLTKHKFAYFFSNPTNISQKDLIVANNDTNTRESFGVGLFDARVDYPPSTILYFKGVGAGSSVQTKFQPILRGYVLRHSGIQENRVLTSQIEAPILFDYDLTQLDNESYWRITYNKGTNQYKIEPDFEYKNWLNKSGYGAGEVDN